MSPILSPPAGAAPSGAGTPHSTRKALPPDRDTGMEKEGEGHPPPTPTNANADGKQRTPLVASGKAAEARFCF